MCTNSWFDPLHFDLALCSFIESLWEEGDSKNEAIDCVSGVLHYLLQLKGKVPGSKKGSWWHGASPNCQPGHRRSTLSFGSTCG